MNQRMTKQRWDALFHALSHGIHEMEYELENYDPELNGDYGAKEYEIQLANEAYRILYRRHGA